MGKEKVQTTALDEATECKLPWCLDRCNSVVEQGVPIAGKGDERRMEGRGACEVRWKKNGGEVSVAVRKLGTSHNAPNLKSLKRL